MSKKVVEIVPVVKGHEGKGYHFSAVKDTDTEKYYSDETRGFTETEPTQARLWDMRHEAEQFALDHKWQIDENFQEEFPDHKVNDPVSDRVNRLHRLGPTEDDL